MDRSLSGGSLAPEHFACPRHSLSIPARCRLCQKVCRLIGDPHSAARFCEEVRRLPDDLIETIRRNLVLRDKAQAMLVVLADPEQLFRLRDCDRTFRLLIQADITYPNSLFSHEESCRLLSRMLKKRFSVTIVRAVFKERPQAKNAFEMLRALALSPHAPFEKRLLLENFALFYVRRCLQLGIAESARAVRLIPDVPVRRALLQYVTVAERLFVLRAMSSVKVAAVLPASLRRYLVENFFVWRDE